MMSPVWIRCLSVGAALSAPNWPNVDRSLGEPVAAAVAGAAARLCEPACALVLADFRDASGTPLAEGLAATRQSPSGYLRWIRFVDGARHPACADSRRVAFTVPGSRVVRICPTFGHLAREDAGYAENVVIHESLHTLGLGEDPPSSEQISNAVGARCGRRAR